MKLLFPIAFFFATIYPSALFAQWVGLGSGKGENTVPLAAPLVDSCQLWLNLASGYSSEGKYQESYDAGKKFVAICTTSPQGGAVFKYLDNDVQHYPEGDTGRFDRYREWLISVLYLNTTDPYYFCADIGSIAGTYVYGKYNIPNASLAVLNYLLSNPTCYSQGLQDDYDNTIRSRHDSWLSGDRKVPEDTILPSLDTLDLGFLNKSSVPSTEIGSSQDNVISFVSNPNPFVKGTTLQFTLNRTAYTTIEIYDELGRHVWGDGIGLSLEAGTHSITIDGKSLPHGTLYARISTGIGEVKTVKLVHE